MATSWRSAVCHDQHAGVASQTVTRGVFLSIFIGSATLIGSGPSVVGPSPSGAVVVSRVPDGGLQPQVSVDGTGVAHLVYLSGAPTASTVTYRRSTSAGEWGLPVRVSPPNGSAMAIGNMRGAHLAIGRDGFVHVAWYGSAQALPRAPGGTTPVLYTRLAPGATSFEAPRNVVQYAVGPDGGTIAADRQGRVYVAWHAAGPGGRGEADGRLWVTRSTDDGTAFAREQAASNPASGACGCCGLGALADRTGALYLLFRSATDVVHRDAMLAWSADQAATFATARLEDWTIGACPMSTFALTDAKTGVLAAWETAGRVQFTRIDPATHAPTAIVPAPTSASPQKYPALAANARGEVLFAWTEGMAWQRGGDLVWQVYGPDGRPTAEHGRKAGVPTWSLVAAYARPDGTFEILY
jgi:hypothetical protein